MPDRKRDSKVQGEGDYKSARRHRRDLERFVAENDTEKLARDAAPTSEEEREEMLEAERKGRARAKGNNKSNTER